MPYFFPKYVVTVSIAPPNDTDCREQLTYSCDPEKLLKDPKLLQSYITAVMQKLEERLEREGAVLGGPVRERDQTGDDKWP